jgi:hypothetical protein
MHTNKARARCLATTLGLFCLSSLPPIAFADETPDACSLLSTQDVATALGVEVDAGVNIGPGACRWNGRGGRPATLRINFTKSRSFDIGKTPLAGYTKTPESGVGDDAYSVVGGGVVTLSVKKGAAFIIVFVQIPNASPEQTTALERKVALKLVEKL